MPIDQKPTASAPDRMDSASGADSGVEPIVIDIGKKKRKEIRKLTKGKSGRLMDRVEETLEHLRENGALADGVQPVIIVVKQKPRRKRLRVAKALGMG